MDLPARSESTRGVVRSIVIASIAVSVFLVWFIYFKTPVPDEEVSGVVRHLPAVNATLNALSGLCVTLGYLAIRSRRTLTHKRFMVAALVCSAFFLTSYLIYHHFQGDTPFVATGLIRPIYFTVLISHIVLSLGVLPLVLITVYRALKGHFELHRRIARITLPIWLYVSVTGVLVFLMLHYFNYAS